MSLAGVKPDRDEYRWMLVYEFHVIGIQPNAYGRGFRMVILAEEL